MKLLVKTCFFVTLLFPAVLLAQNDNFILTCPLNDAKVVPPPKNAIKYEDTDYCIVLVSLPDTVVKSVSNGKITNLEYNEDTKNGIVMYAKINNKDYYFWYTGISKVLVHRNETVTAGQPLGIIATGARIELLMYQFETPVDATKYLDCKGMRKKMAGE